MADDTPTATDSPPSDAKQNGDAPSETVDAKVAMKQQDAVFKAKYGLTSPKGSEILQRRISKGGKGQYFDSGDYNVSKGKTGAPGPPVLRTLLNKPDVPKNATRKISGLAPSPK